MMRFGGYQSFKKTLLSKENINKVHILLANELKKIGITLTGYNATGIKILLTETAYNFLYSNVWDQPVVGTIREFLGDASIYNKYRNTGQFTGGKPTIVRKKPLAKIKKKEMPNELTSETINLIIMETVNHILSWGLKGALNGKSRWEGEMSRPFHDIVMKKFQPPQRSFIQKRQFTHSGWTRPTHLKYRPHISNY